MRNKFDEEMGRLHTMMIELGALCESGIASAIKGLLDHDHDNIKRAMALEQDVDQLEREIEQVCYTLLLRQQPVARDLRTVSACLKMVTDMERISDQAADIAEIAGMQTTPHEDTDNIIRNMSLACIGMVTGCIDAFVQQSTSLAEQVIQSDDVVDRFFDQSKHLFAQRITQNPALTESYIDLLMVSKYLERIADHAVNIGEWVIYIETAQRDY